MEFGWIAIALGDVSWISLAFVLGFFARLIKLPPLLGFLATGFILNFLGVSGGETLQKLADLGITLLLFTIGLKLNLNILIRPQVWLVTALHSSIIIMLFGIILFSLGLMASLTGVSLFLELDLKLSFIIAFALSFSSTVFVVKSLEDKGEMKSLHGSIAIGILVVQDLAAVIFLAASAGKIPSLWALLLFLLIPLRPLLHYLLQKTGHGELLILYGLVLALGGAELFELAGVKGDLGALIMGLLISTHVKSTEMSKSMLAFKDLFLVGFFLSIGMSGSFSLEVLIIGIVLVPLVFIKSALFYTLMTRFKLRARTSLLASLNLANYSEFGLIVVAISVNNAWLNADWLVIIAIALSLSFIIAAPLNKIDDKIYGKFKNSLMKFQSKERLVDDMLLDTLGATIAIFGMGRVGSGAYEKMREHYGDTVIGIDFDIEQVQEHQAKSRNVLHGDPSDADFWDKVSQNHSIKLVMLALPNLQANLDALGQLRAISFSGSIAATARFPDEVEQLQAAGATAVFNIYSEAGAGFAEHVETKLMV
ncbi:Putative glutathione-regulated potassium-efflux system protein KefB [hydrothermal vent metagenome]|uniref:Glutathione-regulated potassium-efflux system protein KefB n=1 Tax=hydrothermal vent metagenome TaxID=652676 RepID=A0A3B1A1W0_9ZZZZ